MMQRSNANKMPLGVQSCHVLGGTPESPVQGSSQASTTTSHEHWIPGPTMTLDSNDTQITPYTLPLPPGARFTGYSLKPESVVERASWAAWYVGSDSHNVINNMDLSQSAGGRLAGISAALADFIPLGKIEAMVGRNAEDNSCRAYVSSHRHAALVLYGKTKRNKPFRRRSQLKLELEVSYIEESSPATSAESPLSAHGNVPPSTSAPSTPTVSSVSSATAAVTPASTHSAHGSFFSTPPDRLPIDPPAASLSTPTVSGVFVATHAVPSASPHNTSWAPGGVAIPHPTTEENESHNTTDTAQGQDTGITAASLLYENIIPSLVPTLTESESIDLIARYISDGAKRSEEIVGRDAVFVLGTTGAGKSTWLNYLMGCRMTLTSSMLSSPIAQAEPSELCPVVPFSIGHTKQSETFLPTIALEPVALDPLAYCDCPGFSDNRGSEINIANAVNIRRMLQAARSVRVVILISQGTLSIEAGRCSGLTDMLRICTQLFGSADTIRKHKKSLLLGVTRSHLSTIKEQLQIYLKQGTPEIMQVLADRLFLYDPQDRGGPAFWDRAACIQQLKSLVPMRYTGDLFQTALDARDEQKLRLIVEQAGKQASDFLLHGKYAEAATCWQTLQRLRVIDKLSVERLLHQSKERILGRLSRIEVDFKDACYLDNKDEAKRLLDAFEQITDHFSKEANTFDLPSLDKLQAHYAAVEERKQQEVERYLEHEAARAQAAKDKQDLLNVIASQKSEMERAQAELTLQHVKMREELQSELARRESAYNHSIKATQEELQLAVKRHEDELSIVQTISVEERTRLLQSTRDEYARHMEAMRSEWLSEKEEYDLKLAAQQAAQAKKQEELQARIDLLSRQQDNETQQQVTLQIPPQAFGAKAWSQYFGEVDIEPSLPSDIDQILNSACPFWSEKQVKETHLLVLIPATVNGKPFSLNLLGELIQHPKGEGHSTKCRYDRKAPNQFGAQCSVRSYWILMTRDVLEGSRKKKDAEFQKDLVAAHARRTSLPYELPSSLEAATAILAHYVRSKERLFTDDPWTYTLCSEVLGDDKVEYLPVVGGFSSQALAVSERNSVTHGVVYDKRLMYYCGVASLRKFFNE